MALMTVYHGGYQAVENPEIRVNKNTKDFWYWILLYGYKGTGSKRG